MVVKKALTRKQIFIPSTVSFCVQEKGCEINKYWLQLETFQRCFKITEGLCYRKVLSLGLSRDFFYSGMEQLQEHLVSGNGT
jgi:hypothetical protein